MAYHVFISYRRDGGDTMARFLYDRLKADGYEPFLDIEQMRSGQFNKQLYMRIEECEDFLLILPPNALDRCSEKEDWVRQEIQEALRLNKNIVPFMLRGFSFPPNLPKEIEEVRYYQGVPASQDYFDSTFDRLKTLLQYHPAKAPEVDNPNNTETAAADRETREPSRAEIIALNKARRIETAKSLLIIIAVAIGLSVFMYCLNSLVKNPANQFLDMWIYPEGERSVVQYATNNHIGLIFTGLIPTTLCAWMMMKGIDIDSPTLKALSILFFILSAFLLHLLPHILITVTAIIIVICFLKAWLFY